MATEILCWLLLAAIFIVMEIISMGLTSIWFAGGAFVAAIASLCGANLIVQIVLFLAVAIALFAFTRPWAKKFLDTKTEKTNAEALVGQNAVVLEEINNLKSSGRVKINGMEWSARAKDDSVVIPEGFVAHIIEIQGVKLIVERADDEKLSEEIISEV